MAPTSKTHIKGENYENLPQQLPAEIGTEGIEPSSSEYLCHKISSVQNRYTCTAPIRKEAKIMKKITLVSTAGLVGFEPTSAAVKVLCLAAWR